MAKKNGIMAIEEIAKFAKKHSGLLFIVANPASDEIFGSYGGKYTFVKFKDESHVVLRVVSPDMFELSIDEFISSIMELTKTDEKNGVQFLKAVGGSVKSLGEAIAKS